MIFFARLLRPEPIAEDMANRDKESYKEENAALRKRIKELGKALAFSRLETEARDLLIDKADITYIMLTNGDVCYLHLITDAYSRMIVGWELTDTLRAAITMKALEQAISQAGGVSLEGLIHHSDRGVQYCCDDYVGTLKGDKIKISMTEDYNPTDNAIAERANGIIKTETVYSRKTLNSMEHARNVIGRFIHSYNYRRPHMSIGYKIPAVAHMETGPQKKCGRRRTTEIRKRHTLCFLNLLLGNLHLIILSISPRLQYTFSRGTNLCNAKRKLWPIQVLSYDKPKRRLT